MSQDDLTINCAQTGTAYTGALNSALGSLNSMHSGAVAPTLNLVDGMLWLDTSVADNIMKIRTGGAWHVLFDFNGTDYRTIIPGLTDTATSSVLALSNTGISLIDGKKIFLGTGNDLEIYHNGTNSIINDSGAGSLFIQSSTGLSLQDTSGNNFAVFTDEGTGGKCELYKGNAVKMTTVTNGIDVTGSVVASTQFEADTNITSPSGNNSYFFQKSLVATIAGLELAIETGANGARTEAVRIDSSGDVGIGTISPDAKLEVRAVAPTIRITDSSTSESWVDNQELGKLEFYAEDTSGNGPYDTAFISAHNDLASGTLPSGALSFGTAAFNAAGGAVERMRLDSNGNLGIGTGTTVARTLHVSSGTTNIAARFESSDSEVNLELKDTNGTASLGSQADFRFKSDGTLIAHMDASGNFGVGVSPETGWDSTHSVIRLGDQGLIANDANEGIAIGANYKTTDVAALVADRFIETDFAARHTMYNGEHKMSYSSASGSAGSVITWVDGLTMDTSGNVIVLGDITATSDERLKDNITLIPNAMDKISKLRGVTFTRNDLHGDKTYTGVIAQDVQKVLPEAVQVHRDHLSVAYGNMVGLLIEGMKEQQKQIDELKDLIKGDK
jgi:hypothetical protein